MIALLLGLMGCGGGPDCTNDDNVLATREGASLTCKDVDPLLAYGQMLAGRPLNSSQRSTLRTAVAEAWKADPKQLTEWAAGADADVTAVLAMTGPQASEVRSGLVYAETHGEGALWNAPEGVRNPIDEAVSVWTRDDAERLSITETDIEGWIRYVSLCREAQGADSLKLSIADRGQIYQMVIQRFDSGTRDDQLAMLAVGAFYWDLKDKWIAADYATQQAWIASAPLPPPMTATSLAYTEVVIREGDVRAHARALHDALGPLRLVPAPP